MLNYRFSKKFKLLEYGKFNHIILTSLLCVGSISLLIGKAQHVEFKMGGSVEETEIILKTSCSYTILNY